MPGPCGGAVLRKVLNSASELFDCAVRHKELGSVPEPLVCTVCRGVTGLSVALGRRAQTLAVSEILGLYF